MISKNLKKRISTSLALLLLLYLIFFSKIVLLFSLIVLGVLSILEFLNITKNIFKKKISKFLSNIIFIIFIFIFCFTFFFFSNFLHLKILLFVILSSCVASDIGGYIFGKLFKGPKLTKISPKKTIAGAIGSFFLTCSTLTALVSYYTSNFSMKILIIGFLISLACQLGDLFFSFLKREAKIKDSGNIFPGHGGVLDRLDGIFIGVPVGFISLILIF